MSLISIPFNAPTFIAQSSDISGSKISGMNYIGAIVFITDTQKFYISGSDLILREYTGAR